MFPAEIKYVQQSLTVYYFSLQGTPDRKITLTSQQNTGYGDNILPEPEEVAARLVDGPSPLQGRLQIYYKGSWRSVCTNSRK